MHIVLGKLQGLLLDVTLFRLKIGGACSGEAALVTKDRLCAHEREYVRPPLRKTRRDNACALAASSDCCLSVSIWEVNAALSRCACARSRVLSAAQLAASRVCTSSSKRADSMVDISFACNSCILRSAS